MDDQARFATCDICDGGFRSMGPWQWTCWACWKALKAGRIVRRPEVQLIDHDDDPKAWECWTAPVKTPAQMDADWQRAKAKVSAQREAELAKRHALGDPMDPRDERYWPEACVAAGQNAMSPPERARWADVAANAAAVVNCSYGILPTLRGHAKRLWDAAGVWDDSADLMEGEQVAEVMAEYDREARQDRAAVLEQVRDNLSTQKMQDAFEAGERKTAQAARDCS